MSKRRDLTGQRFERLLVLSFAGTDRHGNRLWLCACLCGKQTTAPGRCLISGQTRSCGCYHRERIRRHGMTKTPVYESYTAAKARCENPSHPNYKSYGARGIRFLWPDFETFFAEMGHPPEGGTLERIDNDGNYAPGNCRWATWIEQGNNRRSNRMLTAFGSSPTVAQWARGTLAPSPTNTKPSLTQKPRVCSPSIASTSAGHAHSTAPWISTSFW